MIYVKRLKRTEGFTTIELIAVLVIISIAMTPVFYLFYDTQIETAANQVTVDTQTKINGAMKAILDDLRKVDNGQLVGGKTTIEKGSLSTGMANVSDVIVIRYATIQVAYGVSGKTLYRYVSTLPIDIASLAPSTFASGTPKADNITEFKVDNTNPANFKITITSTPGKVGKFQIKQISITNSFVPRFNMSVR